MSNRYQEKILAHLRQLCTHYPHRSTGSQGNIHATDYFAGISKESGFDVNRQEFDCLDWQTDQVYLTSSDTTFRALPSPWSLGCDRQAELLAISNVQMLKDAVLKEKIVLLHGEIAEEQLMPKNFVFYNPEKHRKIIKLLEEKNPLAIITATEKNPELAGAIYPFPLFEDGDFNIPSVYMTAEEGKRLLKEAGKRVKLTFSATRIPAKGCNILASKGNPSAKKVVVSAHIDTKQDTPGAIDNASGIVVMLIMMELLKNYQGEYCLEFLAMNGEDYYAASGEMKYLAELNGNFSQILLNINIDGIGFQECKTGYALFGENSVLLARIAETLLKNPSFRKIDPWYQGDHAFFAMNGVPALALTSENLSFIVREIAHTRKDIIDLLDIDILRKTAYDLTEIIQKDLPDIPH